MSKTFQECFCALCRSPRKIRYSRHLSLFNYFQILFLSLFISFILYPYIGWKGGVSLPLIWIIFESLHKSLYRKELICPVCGFDPKLYRKNVKFAREKVEAFLQNNPESPIFMKGQNFTQQRTQDHP